ncbi:hypothetical protein GHT06_000609 [Daphnia sinensis]|uniref:Reverse transcriptase domain-containing protein n=1 Tax=Daphnia sinensis TaxID=1820382 RepID=A0AAD5KEW4_9CRUS|nr:hypothetical protein GHT06_000609 [Daphnia sinensis]
MDSSNRDSSDAVISLEEVTATEDEHAELSVVEIPAIEKSPGNVLSPANFTPSPILDIGREFANSFNTQNFSWLYELPPHEIINPQILSEEIFDPSPTPEILSFAPSQQSNRGRHRNSSEEQSQREDDFVSLWAPAFLSCETLNDLNDVLERCIADWLPKAQILQDPSPEQPRGNPDQRKRNQNRQMQRARRQIKKKAYEARKIQRLFNIYPRRAVREVLEDRSPSYDGTVQAAEEYLKRTYNRLRPSPQQCQSARELYDTCDWSQPSEDQMNFLNRAPTQQELEAKLRRAINTSPGVDGLEYRHLRAIDPNCILLETTNIPSSYHLQTVLGSDQPEDNRGRFRPWLEHTQLLQTVVEETKTKRRHMCIAWLDMCNAFGSVPHAVLNELFTSLPIPEDLRRILVDIYSGNRMDFAVGKNPSAFSRQRVFARVTLLVPLFLTWLPSPSSGPESPILTPDFYYLARS